MQRCCIDYGAGAVSLGCRSNTTNNNTATVTLKINATMNDTMSMDSYTWDSRQSGSIAVSCSSDVRNGDNKAMTLLLNGNVRRVMVAVSGSTGRWTNSARDTARPSNLKCDSGLKGESAVRTGTATTRRRRRGV
jgi:hypothetical protein